MIVNPKMPFDRERARAYFEKLMSSDTRFEIKRKAPRTRSIRPITRRIR